MTFMDYLWILAVLSERGAPSARLTSASPSGVGAHPSRANGKDITHMPLYRFAFYDGDWQDDPDGTVLDDDNAAHKEALAIAQELARGHDPKKPCRIQVSDGDRSVWIVDWPPP
jgi:hypothetical protein